MNPNLAYAANLLIAAAALYFVYIGKATWEQITLVLAALLAPSGVHVAMQQRAAKQATIPPPAKKDEDEIKPDGEKS